MADIDFGNGAQRVDIALEAVHQADAMVHILVNAREASYVTDAIIGIGARLEQLMGVVMASIGDGSADVPDLLATLRNPSFNEKIAAAPIQSTQPNTLQSVAGQVNAKYWEAHALLHACWMATKDLDENDFQELKSLLGMASGKVLEMQHVVNPHLPKEASHV